MDSYFDLSVPYGRILDVSFRLREFPSGIHCVDFRLCNFVIVVFSCSLSNNWRFDQYTKSLLSRGFVNSYELSRSQVIVISQVNCFIRIHFKCQFKHEIFSRCVDRWWVFSWRRLARTWSRFVPVMTVYRRVSGCYRSAVWE